MKEVGTPKLERLFALTLDSLSSRWASVFSVFVILAIAVSSNAQLQQGAEQAATAQTLFKGPSVRSNAVALAEIYRLRRDTDKVLGTSAKDQQAIEDFQRSLDILYVRASNFEQNLALAPQRTDGAVALDTINTIVAIGDQALENEFAGIAETSDALDQAVQEAASAITIYMNALYHDQREAVSGTVAILTDLSALHRSYLLAMVTFAVVLQTLLRREVLNRRGKAIAEARIAFLAYHDALTGLGNHAALNEALEAAFEAAVDTPPDLAVLYLDIDGFKDINETFGTHIGDAVLRHTAGAIKTACELCQGTPFRTGSDEFVILTPYSDDDILQVLIDRLNVTVNRPLFVDRSIFETTVSVGVASAAIVAQSTKTDGQSVLRAADYTLGEARAMPGKGNCKFVDDQVMKNYQSRHAKMAALEAAIRGGLIDVWMQPQIDLDTLELAGFEALARWQHDGKMVPPDEFVPMAEACGLIVELDSLMLRRATTIAYNWNKVNGTTIGVSVNLSGGHVTSDSLVTTVKSALSVSGLPPELLTLELTETVEVNDWDSVGTRLAILVDMGCQLAIDDFGSGYSSLGYLRKMPAQELKIDRSLVQDIETSKDVRSILTSVVDVARSLGFHTVVEGIETTEQAMLARSLGCNRAQGYLFSKPLPGGSLPSLPGLFDEVLIAELRKTLDKVREISNMKQVAG